MVVLLYSMAQSDMQQQKPPAGDLNKGKGIGAYIYIYSAQLKYLAPNCACASSHIGVFVPLAVRRCGELAGD